MGYWPSKLACILNVILQVGWGIIASIIAGQSMALFPLTASSSRLCFESLERCISRLLASFFVAQGVLLEVI